MLSTAVGAGFECDLVMRWGTWVNEHNGAMFCVQEFGLIYFTVDCEGNQKIL